MLGEEVIQYYLCCKKDDNGQIPAIPVGYTPFIFLHGENYGVSIFLQEVKAAGLLLFLQTILLRKRIWGN